MARMARVYLPGVAQLVQVQGINSAAVFFSTQDYESWCSILRNIAPNHAVDIHAYALVEHSAFLLVTARDETALGRLMQDLGRRYVRQINTKYQRSGTLWEGRYRTAHIQDTPYVLQAYLWLDGMSQHTSQSHHIGLSLLGFIQDHPQYWSLGNTPFDRQLSYKQLLAAGISERVAQTLSHAVQTGWALGDATFLTQAARLGGRRVTPAARGRPKKKPAQPMQ
ncbi:hypothetical protein GCM10009007_08260 [Formosimonas limnophila]|uniref:Transposase IS200-like domain-containing protein n=1 Tax=Formosimonas limnophila TaxID=1384487 RepID=A0A8J3G067_9BURK|nr:transposase [Formosimonas limnophila]GHA69987.1 hypothetical protein GCM10009007_08260 [Formosimonas limnophila]